ncbi:type-1 angiotensin II receptor [Protopterus annectens]|uniref:type-1 angiotensin II receptor n=1 Tax=Protopterus annectens TaxID=7888 RepID=UPI001CF9D393|nr:type-1 angiotensin II receptor [Protopterus annectens]XP_043926561.1 type-1 angiotensin II receptor [Protopterus annectens]
MENNKSQNTTICPSARNSLYVFTMIPIVYTIIFVIGILGNIVVVIVIYIYMKLKTVASIFLFNLALADMTFLITLPLWAASTAMEYHWPFGIALCKLTAGIVTLNLYASIFLLTCLSIDRYVAIVHPMTSRQRRTLVFARLICIIIWVLATVISIPTMCRRNVINNHNVTLCGFDHIETSFLVGMGLTKNILGFLIPFMIILFCYCLIAKTLLQAYDIQQNRSRNDEVLKMLMAVVAAFFLCWIPHQVLTFLYVLIHKKVIQDCHIIDTIDIAMPFTICIAYFNSCLNPVLYGYVGKNFRRHVMHLLKCAPSGIRSHPVLTTKMSSLSLRTSETLFATAKRTINAYELN